MKNAVDGPTASALEQAFADFESDESARVAVFCGADDVFCSGADLKAMASPELRDRVDPHGAGPMGPSRMTLEKPVIAAIEGYAVAGGLELALWSDKRVVSKKVKLVQQQKH